MISKVKKLYQAARDHAGFKRYFKNTSWLFGGQLFRMVLGLFVSVAVARYLGPEDFGLFNYVMSIVALVGVLSQLGLRELARRELVESPERRNEIIGTCFVLNLVAGVVVYSVMLWVVFKQTDNSLVIGLFVLLGGPVLLVSSFKSRSSFIFTNGLPFPLTSLATHLQRFSIGFQSVEQAG